MDEPRRPVRFRELLDALVDGGVDFVIVGGVAAVLEGAPISTFDLDIVYSLDPGNVDRLDHVLRNLEAVYVDPAGRSIRPDVERLGRGGHHLLRTRSGRLDVLSSIGVDETFEVLLDRTQARSIHGKTVRVLQLEALIAIKESVGRAKDRAALDLLRETLEQRGEATE